MSFNQGNTSIDGSVYNTPEGGVAVKFKNNTGAVSKKGSLVSVDATDEMGVALTALSGTDCIGVIYDDGIAEGNDVYVVVSGKADILVNDNVAVSGSYMRAPTAADDAVAVAEQNNLTVTHAATADGIIDIYLAGTAPTTLFISAAGEAEIVYFTVTHECTTAGNLGINLSTALGNIDTAVSDATETTPELVAAAVVANGPAFIGWTVHADGAVLTFTCDVVGPQAGTPSVEVNATGVTISSITQTDGIAADDTVNKVAARIRAATFLGWNAGAGANAIVTRERTVAGALLGTPTYTPYATGITMTFTIPVEGKDAITATAGYAVASATLPDAGTQIGIALQTHSAEVYVAADGLVKSVLKSN